MKLSTIAASAFSTGEVPVATAIALAESHGRVDARHKNSNGTEDLGIWQLNTVHGYSTNEQLQLVTDPYFNAKEAKKVKDSEGWDAWVTYKTGAYLLFMHHDANVAVPHGPTQAIQDGVDSAGKAIGDATGLNAVGEALKVIASTLGSLSNPATWARIGKGALGGTLIIIGVGGTVIFIANKAAGSSAGKAVTKVIP